MQLAARLHQESLEENVEQILKAAGLSFISLSIHSTFPPFFLSFCTFKMVYSYMLKQALMILKTCTPEPTPS
jgi:hypothetical protein